MEIMQVTMWESRYDMQYSKLLQCLKLFSKESLCSYLGEDLVEQLLVEWDNDGGALTKKRLAEMIVQLNGSDVLRKAAFRKEVLMHTAPQDIEELFAMLPESKKTGKSTLEQKARAVAAVPWGPSEINKALLRMLDIDENVLTPQEKDDTVVFTQESMGRFYELLDYQFVIKQRVLTELKQPYPLKRMLIHMPTGTGKTKTAMHTLVHYYNFTLHKQGAIIWLAHTTELLQQAFDTFAGVWTHLGDGIVNTYKLWGSREITIPDGGFNGVLFCGIQKMQAIRLNRPELFRQIVRDARLIIFDEAHKAAATETRKVVEDFMVAYPGMEDRSLIGLTATPGRTTLTSEENKFLSNMFENRLIGVDVNVVDQVNLSQVSYMNHDIIDNPIRYFQEGHILARIRKEQLTYEEQFAPYELQKIKTKMLINGYVDFNKGALEIIGRNHSRNKAIMRKLRQLAVENVPTIVFACSVSHAKLLSSMLSLEDIPNALVLGEMNSVDRAEAIDSFKDRDNPVNILINYEVLTTGFDSTNIRCVFITRPTQSIVLYSQMLGRGLRGPMMGGNEECLLVDIKDNLGKYDADMAFNHFDAYWA